MAMQVFNDSLEQINEPKDARMNFRTKQRIKDTIQKAAALMGVEDTTFALNAAYISAMETIDAHERTFLNKGDHAALFGALDAPAPVTPRLQEAFDRHQRTVVST